MLRKTASLLAFLAVFQIMGGHWIVLQSYAWTKMAVEYTESSGFWKGIEATFDGEHPCDLCTHVQKETQKENSDPIKVDFVKLLKQSEILPNSISVLSFETISFDSDYASGVFSFSTRTDAPLTPPPLV